MLRITAAALAAVLVLPQVETKAQAWPSKPIRFVLPFGAGSATDALARIAGQELEQTLGQPVRSSTPAELATYMKDQLAVWKVALRDAGIEPQ